MSYFYRAAMVYNDNQASNYEPIGIKNITAIETVLNRLNYINNDKYLNIVINHSRNVRASKKYYYYEDQGIEVKFELLDDIYNNEISKNNNKEDADIKALKLVKLSIKDFLKNNDIPIINIDSNENIAFNFEDNDIRILMYSILKYVLNKSDAMLNFDYYSDEEFNLNIESNNNGNDDNIETVREVITEENINSNYEKKSENVFLDDSTIKKLFLKYIEAAKNGVVQFENSLKDFESFNDKKDALEKIKEANFIILSAEYNISKENDIKEYIENYNKNIEKINSDFNAIANRNKKISSLIYVMDVDIEDFNQIYIPKFEINNIINDFMK